MKPVLIVPFGSFSHPAGTQIVDDEAATRIMDQFARWGRDIVVDYMHESMKNCGRAEAAGWVKTASAKITADGIEAPVEWTQDALALIEKKSYRFLSPVFEAVNGKITGLVNLGLTNNPNIHVMPPLTNQIPLQEMKMAKDLPTVLKEILSLKQDAPDAEIESAVRTLVNRRDEGVSLISMLGDAATLLGLAPDATDADVIAKITQLANASATGRDAQVKAMVNDAVAAGKLTPALADWALDIGRANPETLRTFLVNSGPAIPLGGVMTRCGATRSALSEGESRVASSLGLSDSEFKKYANS